MHSHVTRVQSYNTRANYKWHTHPFHISYVQLSLMLFRVHYYFLLNLHLPYRLAQFCLVTRAYLHQIAREIMLLPAEMQFFHPIRSP